MHFFLLVFVFISRSRKLIYSVNIKILVCQIIGPGTCSYARGLVVSFLNFTTRTRPDQTRPDQTHGLLVPPASPRTLSGRRLVRSVSTCTDFVRESGLVWSRRVADKIRGSVQWILTPMLQVLFIADVPVVLLSF